MIEVRPAGDGSVEFPASSAEVPAARAVCSVLVAGTCTPTNCVNENDEAAQAVCSLC